MSQSGSCPAASSAAGSTAVDDFDLAAFVAASCDRHGVPLKVTDASVRQSVAVLLTDRAGRSDAQRRSAVQRWSDSPHDVDA